MSKNLHTAIDALLDEHARPSAAGIAHDGRIPIDAVREVLARFADDAPADTITYTDITVVGRELWVSNQRARHALRRIGLEVEGLTGEETPPPTAGVRHEHHMDVRGVRDGDSIAVVLLCDCLNMVNLGTYPTIQDIAAAELAHLQEVAS